MTVINMGLTLLFNALQQLALIKGDQSIFTA